ncbi:MAG: type IX secretion system PorP/SprF family membrane protein [Parvicellaceae bacterium]|jgi:type IX secretion system PorP/SprF family membrane protein
MKRILFISALVLFFLGGQAQEYPIIGQYMFNEMVLNPASAGHKDLVAGQFSFRKQWINIKGAPTTQNFSIQSPLKNEKMGIGFTFYRDKIGVSSETGVMGNFAYRLKLKNKQRIVFGMGGGLFFQRNRYSDLNVTHSGDANFMLDTPVGVLPNFSAGIRYENDGLEIGVSIPMILTTRFNANTSKFELQNRFRNYNYLFRTVYNYTLNEEFSIKFGGLYKYNPVMKSQMDLTFVAEMKGKLSFGMGYRTDEGVLILSRFKINDQFDFGAQYEIPTSKIYQYRAGSVEVSLIYSSIFNSKAKSPRQL